jgi:hypothetical protein
MTDNDRAAMQFIGDVMILQVLADSEQVNDQEREVLQRWIDTAASAPVSALDALRAQQAAPLGVRECPECGPVTKCYGASEAEPCHLGELETLSREVDAMPGAIRPSEPWPRTAGADAPDGEQK